VTLLQRRAFHPWHDIPPGPTPPDVLTAVIEIPANERNKYELDKEIGLIKLDRVLHSAVHYPGDYGFIPQTYAEDDDPLDVICVMTEPVFPGCLVQVRPVGLFLLVDKGANDEKVIAVPTHDPYAEGVHDLHDLPKHLLREVEHFFTVYKALEGSATESRGFRNADAAREVILAAMARYSAHFGGRDG
jgi:inorganic pyrophosphatase